MLLPFSLKRYILAAIFALSLLMPQSQQCLDNDVKYVLTGLGIVGIAVGSLAYKVYRQAVAISHQDERIKELEKKLTEKNDIIDSITQSSDVSEKKIVFLEKAVDSLKESIIAGEQLEKNKIGNSNLQDYLRHNGFQQEGEVFSPIKEKKDSDQGSADFFMHFSS